MKLTVQEVQQIAQLSRLGMSEEEASAYADQIGNILGYMEQLNKLDTKDIEPLRQAFPIENIWREDKNLPSLSKEQVFANAPEEDEDYFQVPAVREGGE